MAIVLIGFVLLTATAHVLDRMIACTANGLTRDAALKISNDKLKIHLRSKAPDFALVESQFDTFKKWWTFSYRYRDCNIDIIVDECGVSDVGGLTEECVRKK